MIYNVVLISGVQQSNSVMHIHISILLPIALVNIDGVSSALSCIPVWMTPV